jgi:predicted Fe-S protein YdhL (DUF1289 family)
MHINQSLKTKKLGLSAYLKTEKYMQNNPLCLNRCTLERGGDHCKSCGQTVRERYSWASLTEDEKRAAIERAKKIIKANK